jgi:hypothetical protein
MKKLDALVQAVKEFYSFVGVMFGDGPDAIIPETVDTPLGVPIKIGQIMRDAEVALAVNADAINSADVLAYIDEFKGQEDLLTVGEFCEHMAQAIAEGKTLSSTEEVFPHFVDWVKAQGEKRV